MFRVRNWLFSDLFRVAFLLSGKPVSLTMFFFIPFALCNASLRVFLKNIPVVKYSQGGGEEQENGKLGRIRKQFLRVPFSTHHFNKEKYAKKKKKKIKKSTPEQTVWGNLPVLLMIHFTVL